MGLSIDQSLKIRDKGQAALRSVFDAARHFGKTSRDMEADRRNALERIGVYKAPYWVAAYLEGYWRHIIDECYRRDLVFGGFVDGTFYSTHNDRADYYERHGIGPSEYADDGRVTLRGHYWKPEAEHAHRPEARPFFIDGVTNNDA
jgi:hypothetical protein